MSSTPISSRPTDTATYKMVTVQTHRSVSGHTRPSGSASATRRPRRSSCGTAGRSGAHRISASPPTRSPRTSPSRTAELRRNPHPWSDRGEFPASALAAIESSRVMPGESLGARRPLMRPGRSRWHDRPERRPRVSPLPSPTAIQTRRYAGCSGQSQAAPRTPLESPCCALTRRVSTRSEKTNRSQSRGTDMYKRSMFDSPPPSTMTSGSSTLMIAASERASRSHNAPASRRRPHRRTRRGDDPVAFRRMPSCSS